MLKNIFFDLAKKYCSDKTLVEKLWDNIETAYSSEPRHYHTLSHLENLIRQLEPARDQIPDWNTVVFAIFYHDIVYKPTKSNNEEKSAEFAKQELASINYPGNGISKCVELILATKKHLQTNDPDTNLFTDADLSILGQNWDEYEKYYKQIRKEYKIYPDIIYNPGRKKVLDHFLNMNRIYKSNYFYEKLEVNARTNLLREKELYK